LSRMPPHRQLTSQASHGSGIGSVIRPVSSSSMPWTPSRTMCTPNFVSDPWQCRIVPYRRSARTLGESAGWVSPADGPMNGTARGSCNPPGHPIAATSGCDSGSHPRHCSRCRAPSRRRVSCALRRLGPQSVTAAPTERSSRRAGLRWAADRASPALDRSG